MSRRTRTPTATEVKAVAKILEADHAGATSKDVALLVLNEIDALREKSQKYVAVGSIGFDKDRHLFGVGPFTTELQAERGGEAFAWDPKTKTGAGRYWVVPLVGKGRDAWDLVRPAVVSRNEMIADRVREYIAAQKEGRSYVDPHEGKQGW